MVTLAELCASHGIEAIDFLKIDVEGAEGDVIAGGDWRRYRPKVVMVEAIKPISGEPAWEAWEGALLAQGYRFALFDTLNQFYVARRASRHPGEITLGESAVGFRQTHVRDRARR